MSTFHNYGQRNANDWKIIFSWLQQNRLISLMYWDKDKSWLDEPDNFDIGITRNEFFADIEQASERKKCRTNQKKIGDALITSSFQVQLESATQ